MKALFFDLDDTLLDYSGGAEACWAGACATVAAPAGIDPEALQGALAAVRQWFWADRDRHRRERVDMLGAWTKIARQALERCGAGDPGLAGALAQEFFRRRCAVERLFPDARPVLDHFRGRGLALGLVTNGDRRMQRDKIARHRLGDYFDVVVIEGEFGAGKPDARVFQHALEHVGCRPAEAWMVGDHLEWDVAGAQGVGLRAAWLDRDGRGLPAEPSACPDRILRSLTDLIA